MYVKKSTVNVYANIGILYNYTLIVTYSLVGMIEEFS